MEGTYSNLTVAMERKVMAALQARWEALPDELRARPVRPPAVERNSRPSITSLVEEAVRAGTEALEDLVVHVESVRPGSSLASIKRIRSRVLANR